MQGKCFKLYTSFYYERNYYAYCPKLTQIMNKYLKNTFFPDILKIAEITPCFKKGDKDQKENYRPITIL